MKKSLLLLMVVLMSLALVAIAISAPINNVTGTKHNLSSAGTGSYKSIAGNEDQICVFCHTPHQASGISTDPLWNHSLSLKVGGYSMYTSTTFNAGAAPQGTGTQLELQGNGTALSNLCMSCHDGTQAINSLYNPSNDLGGNPTMTAFGSSITTNANIGTDLSNDHPVNFTYDLALANADGGLVDPSSTASACVAGNYANSIGQFQTDYPGSSLAQKLVPGNQFQCSSCHGAHIYYGGAQSGYSPFLKVNNVGSGLCLSCHCK